MWGHAPAMWSRSAPVARVEGRHVRGGAAKHRNWGTIFPDWGPGTGGACASCVGTPPLLFRDVLPNWVIRARLNAETGPQRSDMTFRQNGQYNGIFW